ncbi:MULTISPECIES: hypothetical protein [unclassified Paenibacillus]|uniref:Uncharacterized protein n=1 Tax=Paenibacillus provencensis TaxID=441151 RepID=A0ABW3PTL4_9BACL|nr:MULTISPECIES: hypothetical protein [unclassified Paenibacillus]MCM3130290.1 hypothetical protein [Paenibacillus sp. MER 78]SFS46837.1 hypothetical protein SAMN04488601_101866 [Paenibacillus sp. 453mf]
MWKKTGKKAAVLLAAVIMAGSITGGAMDVEATAYSSKQTGTWLWDTTQIKSEPDKILDFAETQGINAIYLQINRDVAIPYYKDFISKATAEGIEVQILDGRPAWGLSSGREGLMSFVEWIEAYQSGAEENERFSGIHVDIEPHVLAEWKSDRDSVVAQWQSNVSYLTNEAKRMELKITADIPFWLDNYTVPGGDMKISSWMIRQFDAVAVMAYRDTANAIYNAAASELKEASELGKKVSIAVETNRSNEGNFITFYEEDCDYMRAELQELEQMANKHDSYIGISVHDYGNWSKLASR